jgi:hypothetical protein
MLNARKHVQDIEHLEFHTSLLSGMVQESSSFGKVAIKFTS